MPPLRRVKKNEALKPHWKATLREIRAAATRKGFKGNIKMMVFFPHYASASRFFRFPEKTTRTLYDAWACLHLCARHGDPFAARAIARVLTQRLKVEQ